MFILVQCSNSSTAYRMSVKHIGMLEILRIRRVVFKNNIFLFILDLGREKYSKESKRLMNRLNRDKEKEILRVHWLDKQLMGLCSEVQSRATDSRSWCLQLVHSTLSGLVEGLEATTVQADFHTSFTLAAAEHELQLETLSAIRST